MTYEKPIITFKKFHADAFLADSGILSATNNTSHEEEIGPWGDEGFEVGGIFNGVVSLDPDGTGGWFNG